MTVNDITSYSDMPHLAMIYLGAYLTLSPACLASMTYLHIYIIHQLCIFYFIYFGMI